MRAALLLFLIACRAPAVLGDAGEAIDGEEPIDARTFTDAAPGDAVPAGADAETSIDAETPIEEPLEIEFLGVGGFAMSVAGERVLTPPMYSNPTLTDVLTGTVRADPTAIDRFLDPSSIEGTKAILVGHAHYDHLMDLPHLFTKTPEAMIYGNVDMQRLLAAFAPDRAPHCPTSTAALPIIPRDQVFALNDPADDRVDYRNCAEPQGSCTGSWDGAPGEWIDVPNSRMRVRALCSQHPDQFLIFHLGVGCVDEEQCEPPERASDWREGSTFAYLIDFLDPSGAPIFRVYYQDAPTDGPVGYPHPDLLAEKRVDVALLCVGNYDQVADQPTDTIAALDPRYVIAGHWESFFQSPGEPLENLPFLDVDEYVRRMNAALAVPADAPIEVDGVASESRGFKPDPGTSFRVRSSPK